MKRHLLFTIVLLFGVSGASYAQKHGRELVDSLLPELQKTKADTNRVKILTDLSFEYSDIDPDIGIRYSKQALELAAKLKWDKGQALANRYLGINYENKTDFANAILCYQSAMETYRATGRKNGIAHTAQDLAALYLTMDNYPKGLEYALTSLRLFEEVKDSSGIAHSCRIVADIYYYYNDYPNALEYFQRALKLLEISGDLRGVLLITGSLGSLYRMQDNYAKALEYFVSAKKMNDEFGSKEYDAILANSIGDIYTEQHKYREALTYLFKALAIAKERNNESLEASALMDIGRCYVSMAENAGKQDYASGLGAIGNAAEVQGEQLPEGLVPTGKTRILQQAVIYLNRAISIHKKRSELERLSPAYWNLAKADSLLGNYKDALHAYSQHMLYKDSIFSKEKSIAIARLEMRSKMHIDSTNNAQTTQIAETKYRNQRTYTIMGIAGIVLLVGVSIFILKERGKSEKERKKSDGLLLNILPEEVATELKATGTTTAKHYDNVTVLFTDFVNFTQAGEQMSPQGLIDELHACFKNFDEITGKYNIEKIKTIGDAYLAVCGLPASDPKHAENIVRAAVEINAFMQDRLAKLGSERTFAVRIGIHSGSVVAGIVGVKKFAYDIWGDTVNTAARMEQKSEAGKINISETTYELVKDKFSCEYRGEVEVKGKGVMKMYFVV